MKIEYPPAWTLANHIVSTTARRINPSSAAFEDASGCQQRVRSQSKIQSGYYDLPYYKKVFESAWSLTHSARVVVDLGCGDGRFTKILLEKWKSADIIALDFNKNDLESLWKSLTQPQKTRVHLIHGQIDDLLTPEFNSIADVVTMLEVSYILPDPQAGYDTLKHLLRRSGAGIVSNVSTAAYFVHALLNDDFEQLTRIAFHKEYKDLVRGQQGKEFIAHLFDQSRMRKAALRAGLTCAKETVVPAGPSLLLHMLRKNGHNPAEYDHLLEQVSKICIDIPRLYIDLLTPERPHD